MGIKSVKTTGRLESAEKIGCEWKLEILKIWLRGKVVTCVKFEMNSTWLAGVTTPAHCWLYALRLLSPTGDGEMITCVYCDPKVSTEENCKGKKKWLLLQPQERYTMLIFKPRLALSILRGISKKMMSLRDTKSMGELGFSNVYTPAAKVFHFIRSDESWRCY